MSTENEDIPPEELERIKGEANLYATGSGAKYKTVFKSFYEGKVDEYLRHLSPSSKLETGFRWVSYSGKGCPLPQDDSTLIKYNEGRDRELGSPRLIKWLYENGWEDVQWLDESISSSEPSEQSQPDAFLEWLDGEIDLLRQTIDQYPSTSRFRRGAQDKVNGLLSAREKHRSLHAQPKLGP